MQERAALSYDHATMRKLNRRRFILVNVAIGLALFSNQLVSQTTGPAEPIRRTISFEGEEWEYHEWLPSKIYSAKTYWPLLVFHGGGGTAFMAAPLRAGAEEAGLDAIVITPTLPHRDSPIAKRAHKITSAFLDGEDRLLRQIVEDVGTRYRLRDKMLLSGVLSI